jgi:hypothetical protein
VLAGRYQWPQKNAVAATLAWMAQEREVSFDVYYDLPRTGRHYGGGASRLDKTTGDETLASLAGGLVTGGRHLETLATALQRFEARVISVGQITFANTLAALACDSGAEVWPAEESDVVGLYNDAFSKLEMAWPDTAVLVDSAPRPGLEGVDAYLWPEIFYRHALGIERTLRQDQLQRLRDCGVRRLMICGLSAEHRAGLVAQGFEVEEVGVVESHDDYATVTARMARRWAAQRRGWLLGDPVLASCWLPTACREHRAVIFGTPQSAVLTELREDIGAQVGPAVLGRQQEDRDFFELSRLGQSFQLVDPGRPPLPVLLTHPPRWAPVWPEPGREDPDDDQLLAWAREGRVLTSLVFWTGMLRETENLFALTDLVAMTGLQAGLALTVQSLACRPSPLDLLTAPLSQGGVFPNLEVLLASCGTGAAIESLLTTDQLTQHLEEARIELQRLGIPRHSWPQGWWATMDAPLVPRSRWRSPKPVRLNRAAPYGIEVRFHSRDRSAAPAPVGTDSGRRGGRERVERFARKRLKGRRLQGLFSAYRPYEGFAPGPIQPELAAAVRNAGFSYMLSKSGFGGAPRVMLRDEDFVALNYTAGQWDGWTPFETINCTGDLRQAERKLLAHRRAGWLLGSVDACLWTFSGELWERAPELAEIARFLVSGGRSGRLINVAPRVVARYARILDAMQRSAT